MPVMAPKKADSGDRHKQGWQVRLSLIHRQAADDYANHVREQSDVEVEGAAIVRAALEKFLAEKGFWPIRK